MVQVVPHVRLPDKLIRGATLGVAAVVTSAGDNQPLHTQPLHNHSENPAKSVPHGHDILSYTGQSIPCHMAVAPYPDYILN